MPGDSKGDILSTVVRTVRALDRETSRIPDRVGELALWLSEPLRGISATTRRRYQPTAKAVTTAIANNALASFLMLWTLDSVVGYRLPVVAYSMLLAASAGLWCYGISAVVSRAPLADPVSQRAPRRRRAAPFPTGPNRAEVIMDTVSAVTTVIRYTGTLLTFAVTVLPIVLNPGALTQVLTRSLPEVVPGGTALLDLLWVVCIGLALLTQPFRVLLRGGTEILAIVTVTLLPTVIASFTVPHLASLVLLANFLLVMTGATLLTLWGVYVLLAELCRFVSTASAEPPS